MKPSERIKQMGVEWSARQPPARNHLDALEAVVDASCRAILQHLDEEQERRAKWEAMVEGKLATLEIDPPEIDPSVGPGPSVDWGDLVDAARDEAEMLAKQTDAWVKDRLRNSSLPEPPKGDE